MAAQGVAVTYRLGRMDRIDPKLAPFGVLKVGKNLRVRKDGRLGVRHGYQPLTMTTRNGTLKVFDLFEFGGRLCALGNDGADGYPTDVFEYLGLSSERWRGTDPTRARVTVNPFTNLREVAGIPWVQDGARVYDAAAGGGYVALLYKGVTTGVSYLLVVNAANDQTVFHESIGSAAAGTAGVRVIWSVNTFYAAHTTGSGQALDIYAFRPGTDTSASLLVSPAGSVIDQISAFDLCPVGNPTSGRFAVVYDRGSASDLEIKVYNSAGVQVGSTASVSGTDTVHCSLEADEADDTINLLTIETATTARLRTFDFSGSLLDGPTALTSATNGAICRLPALGSFGEDLAIVTNTSSTAVRIEFADIDTHALSNADTYARMQARTRPVSGRTATQEFSIAFGALLAPDLSTLARATNALVFACEGSIVHVSARDYLRARDTPAVSFQSLTRDATTGKLCWPVARDPGVPALRGMPVVSLLDYQSAARRQIAKYGGLAYFAGATPAVYDGRVLCEAGFSEVPAVVSATAGSGGSLTPSGTYSYIVHWEYVFRDGSVILSPPSEAATVTLGGAQNRVTVVVTSPHSVRIAMGDAVAGASVSAVLSRTVWEASSSTQGSVFRRVESVGAQIGIANYGATVQLVDDLSDADAADEDALYTQAERGALSGPLEHNGPQPCSFITATEARLITGGLSRPFEFQISKGAFLGESIAFSEFSAFFGTVSGEIRGVHRLDQARLIFTDAALLSVFGDGPDDVGGGALGYPIEIPTPSGLEDWRSFLEAPDGLWFQLDDSKLFRIPRGGGSPEWLGVDVQDTLSAFPVITATAKHKRDNAGIFACENSGGTAARLLVYDFRTQLWLEDTPVTQTSEGVEAMTTLGDSIAYASGGVVYVQSTSSFTDGSSTFIEHQATTQPLYPFGLGGYGLIHEALLTLEWRGACTLGARVSFDDGVTFSALSSFTLTGLTVGQTKQLKWSLPRDVTSTVVLEFTVTDSGSGASEGLVFNQLDLLVEREPGLRELAPGEMA